MVYRAPNHARPRLWASHYHPGMRSGRVAVVAVVTVAVGLSLLLMRPLVAPVSARQGTQGPQAPPGAPSERVNLARPVTYFIAEGTGEAGYRRSDRELAQWAFEAWERSAPTRVRLQPATEPNALVRLYWAASNNGQI